MNEIIKILHIDNNHPLIWEQLQKAGFQNEADYTSTKEELVSKIKDYQGIVIRSRVTLDKPFLDQAKKLQFIARVGAGLESIDVDYANKLGIEVISSPEGNRNAVGEHALGMLLSLMNKINKADSEVKKGLWNREANRGEELDGKTIGIVGYGNMGKAFAKKLRGFDVEVLCYDILPNVGNENAKQVSWEEFCDKVEVISLHTPWTDLTNKMINDKWINQIKNPFWLINTARGKSVVTADLVTALKSGKIKGAALDVLEYEKLSFENLFEGEKPEPLSYLLQADNVIVTPHIAGWTVESKTLLAQVIVDKVLLKYHMK